MNPDHYDREKGETLLDMIPFNGKKVMRIEAMLQSSEPWYDTCNPYMRFKSGCPIVFHHFQPDLWKHALKGNVKALRTVNETLETVLKGDVEALHEAKCLWEKVRKGDVEAVHKANCLRMWQQALKGNAEAVREANRTLPGCIYEHEEIRKIIVKHTWAAVHSPDADTRKRAVRWLQTALIPKAISRSKKSKPVSRVSLDEARAIFFPLYQEIVTIRHVYESARSGKAMLFRQFKGLRELDDDLLNAVIGEPFKEGICDAREAACLVLAAITGYRADTIYKRVKQHSSSWLKELAATKQSGLAVAKTLLRQ